MNKIYLPDHAPSLMVPNHFHFTFFLLLFTLMHFTAGAQVQVNDYARVSGIDAARTTLTITQVNQTHGGFASNRQVIVLQMQDNVIANTGNNQNFGTLTNIAQAGLFEVATIQSVNGSQIKLTTPLRNAYNTGNNSRVQMVSFPQLGNPDFTPNEDITAIQWNGNTGGVIAFQVPGTLNLGRSIIADGAGFHGGDSSNNASLNCDGDMYINNANGYGAKGEGIYRSTNTTFNRDRARILSGGGGANGFNAGGAGGSNYAAGGDGGPGRGCNADPSGGLGGVALNMHMRTGDRVFMGGGGGGGQGNSGNQTRGGNGGGIIFIKANSIATGFFDFPRISANGDDSRNTLRDGNDGAGGAGAGGTILLQLNDYNIFIISLLVIQANGGSGGDVEDNVPHGGGGGGGQGAILFSGARPTGNIFINTLNGQGGLNSQNSNSRAGNGVGANNAGIISGVGSPLPVRLLFFAAEKNDTKTRLTWTATDELNTSFHVQHSTDGNHFNTIGTVSGSGKGTVISNYSFTHHVPAPGANMYRLEMIEEPDYKTYSTIAVVNFNDLPEIPVAYPNPAKDHFSLRMTDINNNINYAVSISDLAGKIVYTGSLRPVNNIITVHTGNNLLPGVYIVTVNTATRKQFVKLVIK